MLTQTRTERRLRRLWKKEFDYREPVKQYHVGVNSVDGLPIVEWTEDGWVMHHRDYCATLEAGLAKVAALEAAGYVQIHGWEFLAVR